MEKKYKITQGCITAFDCDGCTLVARVAKIVDGRNEITNIVDITNGCKYNGTLGSHSTSECRDISRSENIQYHKILTGEDLYNYDGEDCIPAGTLLRVGEYLCILCNYVKNDDSDIPNIKVSNVYDTRKKRFSNKFTPSKGSLIGYPTSDESLEFWDYVFKKCLEEANKK